MVLPTWEDRSIITASLLNPAFCGEVLRLACVEYSKNKKDNISFPLVFIILPLVLYKTTRNKFPKTKTTKLHDWLSSNDEMKIGLAEKIKYIVPYTRESLLFLYKYNIIAFSQNGSIEIIKVRKPRYPDSFTQEMLEIFDKSRFLGKWISTFPKEKITYAMFGIQP